MMDVNHSTPAHTGRTVLITGACGGIGVAIAARYVQAGAAVCLVDRDAVAG
ncbi:SDR family NAD(P)-dependent oxidoreductase, partial [Stenotrophomonas sp. YIM B06876]|uniref:SDR family NAD(P)-dependent oxidoreductase n=1 Tax=Stenotrophomonas sp. YIM B06876 TaxID=3060211 RepID=UPI0031F2E975